jgi:hypothetical protein
VRRELALLVMDELHVYRGRQGADVAMLFRRVRQRSGSWRRSGTSCCSRCCRLCRARAALAGWRGGGQVQVYEDCHTGFPGACIDGFSNIFHTDATQVLGWEKFRIVDQGNCKYTIQTNSGFFFGLYETSHGMLFTTRRSEISDNEQFEFVMSGLGSPPILR